MSKQEMLSFSGIVEDLLPNAMFRVKLENGHIVTAVTIWPFSNFTLNIAFGNKSSTIPENESISCFDKFIFS